MTDLTSLTSSKLFSGPDRRLRMGLVLLTEADYDDILQWTVEDMGDRIQSETVVDGYKYNTLLGRRFIRTIKTDILRRGVVYGFTSPEFLGCFYVLNNTKFYVDKVRTRSRSGAGKTSAWRSSTSTASLSSSCSVVL